MANGRSLQEILDDELPVSDGHGERYCRLYLALEQWNKEQIAKAFQQDEDKRLADAYGVSVDEYLIMRKKHVGY